VSDAKVQFFDGEHTDTPGKEQVFSFRCPKYGHECGDLIIAGRTTLKRDGQNKNGGVAMWDWDGNREAPTFQPSINCGKCWHGYIRNGRCVDQQGNDEPEPQPR
jgi:hypothetical protein